MRGFNLQVCVHGRTVKTYSHEGEVYVEGRKGSEYTLKVHNNTSRRAVAVISVDGMSVMDGKMASRKGAGYVLDAHSVTEIPGWRLDNKDVARFQFGTVPSSFAARQGKPANVGVIGCVVFYEKEHEQHFCSNVFRSSGGISPRSVGQSLGAGSYSGSMEPSQSFSSTLGSRRTTSKTNLGTGFGRRDEHQVRQVSFEAEEHQADELVIHYDDRAGLMTRGIDLLAVKVKVAHPFPKDDQIGCMPPPGWSGR